MTIPNFHQNESTKKNGRGAGGREEVIGEEIEDDLVGRW
jgi:hypothetical protein